MMDQYKNETAQVHAPTALIEKTKAAVREEEERIRRERVVQIQASAPQVTYADYAAYQKKRSLRKWTYPLTAAAAVVILLSVSLATRGVWTSRFTKNQETADGAVMKKEVPAAEEEASAEIMEGTTADDTAGEMNGAADTGSMMESAAEAPAADAEMIEGAAADDTAGEMDGAADIDNMAESAAEAPAADSAGGDMQRDMLQDKDAEKEEIKPFRSVESGCVRVEAVEKKPDFYDNPEAEDVVYEGLTFRVIKEEKGWAAYVEAADETAYVISGTSEELDTFLKEGYAELKKMGNSRQ